MAVVDVENGDTVGDICDIVGDVVDDTGMVSDSVLPDRVAIFSRSRRFCKFSRVSLRS